MLDGRGGSNVLDGGGGSDTILVSDFGRVTRRDLHALYDLLKWGPTAFNAQPARYVFVRSTEAKERLKPALSSGNVAQTLAASVTVIEKDENNRYLPFRTSAGVDHALPSTYRSGNYPKDANNQAYYRSGDNWFRDDAYWKVSGRPVLFTNRP